MEGWSSKNIEAEYLIAGIKEEYYNINTWVTAFYFILTTSTTIGYGDLDVTTSYEKSFMIFAQFIGICMFSMIQGVTHNWIFMPTVKENLKKKGSEIEKYL